MTARFDPQLRLIVVGAVVEGPAGSVSLRLALDTGSTKTLIDPDRLQSVGLASDPALPSVAFHTVTGRGTAQLVRVGKLRALDVERTDFVVVGVRPQSSLRVDGLLGLDFIRGRTLTVDFRIGQIDLA